MAKRRSTPLRFALAVIATAGVGAPAACVDDLPPPTACPPEPKQQATSCVDALQTATPGCLTDEPARVACLTGPRNDCRCMSTDCPDRPDSCYPDGDCPAVVAKRDRDAICKRLAPEDIGLDQPSAAMCLCRCAGCAAVCDGTGPVMGVLTGPGVQAFPVLFDIGPKMPDRGKLGIYLRVRGLANVGVAIATGDIDNFQTLDWQPGYFVLTPPSTEFVEQVLLDDELLHGPAYTWTEAKDKPTVIALAASFNDTDENLALFELDCLVPFVVP